MQDLLANIALRAFRTFSTPIKFQIIENPYFKKSSISKIKQQSSNKSSNTLENHRKQLIIIGNPKKK